MMTLSDSLPPCLTGPAGSLVVLPDDEITLKLAMLYEGECDGLGPLQAAAKFGYSKARYFQLRHLFEQRGAIALLSQTTGPKSHYRRTDSIVRQIIRHRFLDPEASVEVIAQKLRQTGHALSIRSIQRTVADYGLQKKLYALNPQTPPQTVLTQRTLQTQRPEPADPQSLERQVRQLLADKVSGNQLGLWLLIPEHLRLGTWDLLNGWAGPDAPPLAPRLALQLIHEAVFCTCNLRAGRTLSQKGFELANGLPFVAADAAIHDLLNAHTVAQAQSLQVALGKLRRASGHFQGRLLAIDPHRLRRYTKRQRCRRRPNAQAPPIKMSPTFFLLDAQATEPICFTIGSGARRATQAAPDLFNLAQEILGVDPNTSERPLVLADEEHYTALFLAQATVRPFDVLVPMRSTRHQLQRWQALPPESFQRHWAGYATCQQPYVFAPEQLDCWQIVQRSGERPEDYQFKGYLSNAPRPEVPTLTRDYPQRWPVEEFFKFNQALGWQRAGTLNLNIRYGQMTLALIAQTLLSQFRQRVGSPYNRWDAAHWGKNLFGGLEGDLRVEDDTLLVTYYNAPNVPVLRAHYEGLPAKLQAEKIDPRIPWLYHFKLDFRFK